MQEIMLVNPARRPTKRRKAASPAQKRARAAFAAASRARSKGAVMANPRKRRTRKHAKRASNPVAHHRVHHRARRRNPIHARRRRNPIAGAKPMSLLTPALIGALGATAVNTILAQVSGSLPATLTTGNMKYVTSIAAALGLAMFASKAGTKHAMLLQMAEGSLTVTLHQAIVDLSGGMGMTLSGRGMGVYMPGRGAQAVPSAQGNPAQLAGMGAYLTGNGSPAAAIQAARQRAMAPKTMKGFGF